MSHIFENHSISNKKPTHYFSVESTLRIDVEITFIEH